MESNVLACISGWDDTEELSGCLQSLSSLKIPAVYLDGAYSTYQSEGDWWTPDDKLHSACEGHEVTIVDSNPDRPWYDEAEKRTELARVASAIASKSEREWLLFLDTDERLESDAELFPWLSDLAAHIWWVYINLYRPERPGMAGGFGLPRLIRPSSTLRFVSPLDYTIERGAKRIAHLPGERIPEEMQSRWATMSPDVARIRHDKMKRPNARLRASGRYIRWRQREYGR